MTSRSRRSTCSTTSPPSAPTTAGCTSFNDRTGDPVTVNGGLRPARRVGPGRPAAPAGQDRRRDQRARRRRRRPARDRELGARRRGRRRGARHAGRRAQRRRRLRPSGRSSRRRRELPPAAGQDVITNAIIYKPAAVERTGESRALGDQSGDDEAFGNAREPIGQVFTPVGGGDAVLRRREPLQVQGLGRSVAGRRRRRRRPGRLERVARRARRRRCATGSRRSRATPRRSRSSATSTRTRSRTRCRTLYDAGYTDAADGARRRPVLVLVRRPVGLARPRAAQRRRARSGPPARTSGRSTPRSPSRSSTTGTTTTARSSTRRTLPLLRPRPGDRRAGRRRGDQPVDLTLLDINDFHGRIDANTVKFAGTVEKEKAAAIAAGGPVAFVSAGDNISASLFASAVQQDQPTIDVLNALELNASAVGNHEFDKGFADLTDRVIAGGTNATWDYLGRERLPQGHDDAGAAGVRDPRHGRRLGRRHRRGHRGDPVAGQPRRHHRARLRRPGRRGQPRRRAAERRRRRPTARPTCSSPATTRAPARALPNGDPRGGGRRRAVRSRRSSNETSRDRRRDLHRPHPPAVRVGGAGPRRARQDPADPADRAATASSSARSC